MAGYMQSHRMRPAIFMFSQETAHLIFSNRYVEPSSSGLYASCS